MSDHHDSDHHDSDPDDLDRELQQMLREAEETVAQLKDALRARRNLSAQHAEIDRLEEHLANARVRWTEVRQFLNIVWREITAGANTVASRPIQPGRPGANGGEPGA
ncbi:hypothetical protein ACNUDN_02695 [Mycobacterium sp. smrl_JER01]|uniref:hypothetical protein n=1 Tax=Mycobacterium sp. smrl_JER01 TaxID=3402633 RepID=UPI003AD6B0D3